MALERADYVEVEITPAMADAARAKYAALLQREAFARADKRKLGALPECTVYGFLGEQMVITYLGAEDKSQPGYDLLYAERYRLEVKTISAKFCPPTHYDCAVNNFRVTDSDLYVFTRVLFDMSRGWILGAIGCKEFGEKARYVPVGSSPGGNVPAFVRRDCKLIPISDLYPIAKLVRMAEARRLKLSPSSGGGTNGEIWANPEAERARRMTVPEWVAEYERNERPI